MGNKESVQEIVSCVVHDTREQLPLHFEGRVKYKLNVGDYACLCNVKWNKNGEPEGQLLPVVFERKSPEDLYGTIISGHERFKKEIFRAIEDQTKLIVIVECSYLDFINKEWDRGQRTQVPTTTLIKILHTLMVRYNLEFVFCDGRKEMKIYIQNYFTSLFNECLKEGYI